MIIPSFKELKEVCNSRYELVILTSKRARKIIDDNPPLIETENKKPVTIAIEEVLNGSIKFGEKMSDGQYEDKINTERQKVLDNLKQEEIDKLNSQEEAEEE